MGQMNASAGALLALAILSTARAHAAPDADGAVSAAPTSCSAEQFVLRAYVIAVRTGDIASGAQDPARIQKAITPLCRQAIDNGRWPGLANELLARAVVDPPTKSTICEIAPPEALSAIVQWETADDSVRASYDVPCAVALLRHRPDDFAKVVWPRFANGGCAFSELPARLGEAVDPAERPALLPTLDFATRTHAQGRDHLYDVLCQDPSTRAQAACKAPAVMEAQWAHQQRIKRAAPGIALRLGLSLLFALAACLLRYFLGKDWPALRMSIAATAITSATVAWLIAAAPTPGTGAPDTLRTLVAMVVAPLAAVAGGAGAWVFIRAARAAALPWCLLHAAVYGLVTAVHAWTRAWDRLC
ncbi:MAG TPA: hypothetical protein VGP07_25045 [Polyangia bacterium]|jgi:hypothetical protein